MSEVLHLVRVMAWLFSAWFIFLWCMLSAYFPINDKETSSLHRAIWWASTAFILFVWYRVWQ